VLDVDGESAERSRARSATRPASTGSPRTRSSSRSCSPSRRSSAWSNPRRWPRWSRCASRRITPATYKAIGLAVAGLPTVPGRAGDRGAGELKVQRTGGTVQARRHRRHLRWDLGKRQPQCPVVASLLFSASPDWAPHRDQIVAPRGRRATSVPRITDGPMTTGRAGIRSDLSGCQGCPAHSAVRWPQRVDLPAGAPGTRSAPSTAPSSAGRTRPMSCWPPLAWVELAATRAGR
jgi:hypothetical protein